MRCMSRMGHLPMIPPHRIRCRKPGRRNGQFCPLCKTVAQVDVLLIQSVKTEAAPMLQVASKATPADVLAARYEHVRWATEALCEPLVAEDYVVQSMPDV